MSEKYCTNCCKYINAATFFLHERMCSLNVKKCPKCNKPFTIDDLEEHIQEMHTEVECEFCKKKFPRAELDKHKTKCDSKLVPCIYCELQVLLGELKEHQKACGAITEPCVKCNRYIQRKHMDQHLKDGCPPPKNERKSVDIIRNDRLSLNKNHNNLYGNNNINNNYIPININDYIPDEIFFEDTYKNKKTDIKMHDNIKKPNLQIRPASGKKILNEKAKKNMSNLGNGQNINNVNNININNKDNDKFINNKEMKNKNNSMQSQNYIKNTNKITSIDNKTNNNNFNNKTNNINIKTDNRNNKTNNKSSKPVKKESDKSSTYIKFNKNDYLNKQNTSNKNAIQIKQINDSQKKDSNINNSRYNERSNNKKLSSKPAFNITKGSMRASKDTKETDEEFRKTRDKLTFKEAKRINNINLNSNTKRSNFNQKKLINDDDYIANFNFGEVDDDQLIQQVIEQSIKEQKKK